MRWPRAYPGLKRRIPRRARRGLSTLLGVLLLAGLVVPAVLHWQVGLAQERLRGYASHLADVTADEGYGLHHWLHQNPVTATTARALTAAEGRALASHAATTTWRRSSTDITRVMLPRGWEILHMIGMPDSGRPDGVLVLRPSADLIARPTWATTRRAVEIALDAEFGGIAETLASAALRTNSRPFSANDIAVLASRFARLDAGAVLREHHVGHPDPEMKTDLRLGSNDITDVKEFQAESGTDLTLVGRLPLGTQPTGKLEAEALVLATGPTVTGDTILGTVKAADVTLSGTVTGVTTMRADDVAISGTLNTPDLTACADVSADLCGGGDLDIEAATGTPDWTEAVIFGDVIIRDGNQLTGVDRTTVTESGIFGDNIPGNGDGLTTDALTVRGCLRSTAPFIYSRGC